MTKDQFNSMFDNFIDKYVDSYNGKQPIMSWEDGKKPTIEPEFLEHLPAATRQNVLNLVKSIEV